MIILTDIHGNFKTMQALLAQIPKEEKDKGIVIAGDLVDRGPRCKEVVQWCIDNNISVVKGNHEEMMIDEALREASYFIKNNTYNQYGEGIWGVNGGFETLESYITDNGDKTATFDMSTLIDHIEWMKKLPYYLEFKDIKNDKGEHLLVSHSSAAKVWKWSEEHRKQQHKNFTNHLTWGRPNNIDPIPGVFNVFGHTPTKDGPKIKSHYANIDTGCAYNKSGYHTLTALQFPEMIVYEQENIDKKE